MSQSENCAPEIGRNTVEELKAYSRLARDFEQLAIEFATIWNPVIAVCNAPIDCNVGIPRLDRFAQTDEDRQGNDRRWQHWRAWAKSAGAMIRRLGITVDLHELRSSETHAYLMAAEILVASANADETRFGELFDLARANAHEMDELDERFFQVVGEIFEDWKWAQKIELRRKAMELSRRHGLDKMAYRDNALKGQLSTTARHVQFTIPFADTCPIQQVDCDSSSARNESPITKNASLPREKENDTEDSSPRRGTVAPKTPGRKTRQKLTRFVFEILEVLIENQAHDEDSRMCSNQIARTINANRKLQGDPNKTTGPSVRQYTRNLKKKGLIDTKSKGQGGSWLTKAGIKAIEKSQVAVGVSE